jgi:hypothetical protein
MPEMTLSSLASWRADPILFVEQVLHDPETKRPFVLLPAERSFLAHAFKVDESGRLLYPEQVYSAPKKSGKSTLAALHVLTLTLLFGGAFAEAVCCANDLEQARGRVFELIHHRGVAAPETRGADHGEQDCLRRFRRDHHSDCFRCGVRGRRQSVDCGI